MIEEVVNSILEAEDVAEKRVAAAKAEAGEIVVRAETEADSFKKKRSAENKAYFAEKSKEVEAEAKAVADAKLSELKAETDKETATYGKNVDAAVKIILEQLL